MAPREGGGVTLNLAEQGAALPSTQPPLIRQRDAERYARAGAELPRAPDGGESGADRAAASADDGWHPRSSFSRAAPRARGREAVWDEGRSLWQGGAGTRGGEAPRRGGEDSGYPESGDEPGWAAGPPPEERPLISAAASAVRTPGDVARDMAWAAAGGSLLQGGGPRREGPGPLLPGLSCFSLVDPRLLSLSHAAAQPHAIPRFLIPSFPTTRLPRHLSFLSGREACFAPACRCRRVIAGKSAHKS